MDNYYINAASQLYVAELGHLVIVTNGHLLHKGCKALLGFP